MAKKLFVGNLPFKTTEEELRELFSAAGNIEEIAIPTDRMTGRPRGFAFVTMSSDEEATKAIDELNGKEIDGREIVVNEAKPREDSR